jgi:hypothetical protein
MKGRNRRKLLKVFIYPEPLVCRLVGWPRCGQRKCVDCWAAVANISILIFGHILFLSARLSVSPGIAYSLSSTASSHLTFVILEWDVDQTTSSRVVMLILQSETSLSLTAVLEKKMFGCIEEREKHLEQHEEPLYAFTGTWRVYD